MSNESKDDLNHDFPNEEKNDNVNKSELINELRNKGQCPRWQ